MQPQPHLATKPVGPLAQQELLELLAFQVQVPTCQAQEPPTKVEQAQVRHINQEQVISQEQEDTNQVLAHHSNQAQVDINLDQASRRELALVELEEPQELEPHTQPPLLEVEPERAMAPQLSKVAALALAQQAPAEQQELVEPQAQVARPGTEARTTLPTEGRAIIDLLNLF